MNDNKRNLRPSADVKLRARVALRDRDKSAAERCAKALAALGFEVARTSSRGVDIAATQSLFEEVFGQDIDTTAQPCFKGQPIMPEACDVAESIYFPSKPTFFD